MYHGEGLKNNQGKFSLKTILISGLILVVIALGAWLVLPKQENEIEAEKGFSISQPSDYKKPLVIATFGNILKIAPVNAATAKSEQINIDTIKYIDAYLNTDVEQIKYPNKLKESLILKRPGHPDKFEYQINIDDYLWRIDIDGNIIFSSKQERDFSQIKSDTGEKVPEFISRKFLDEHPKIFKIPAPFLVDAQGNKSDRKYVQVEIKDDRLILTPDKNWLQSHPYPIILDPTVEKMPQPIEEVSSKRSPTGVTFRNDDGSFSFSTQMGNNIHYYDEGGQLQPVNTMIQNDEQGREYVEKVPYYRGYALDNPGYKIERKDQTGWVQEELLDIDGTTNFSQTGQVQDNKKIFREVFTDTDFEVEFTSSKGVKGNIILKSAQAPREFKFKLSSDQSPQFFQNIEQIVFNKLHVFAKAWDSDPTPPLPENPLEQIGYERIPLSTTFDPVTQIMTVKVESLPSDVIYPVIVDPDTMPQESIGATEDDCFIPLSGPGCVYNMNYVAIGYLGGGVKQDNDGGFRFTTIPIDRGATINSATMGFTIAEASYSKAASVNTIQGAHDDNPGSWSEVYGPNEVTPTTAYVSYQPETNMVYPNWYYTSDFATVVSDIIEESWWDNNDALSIVIFGGSSDQERYLQSYENPGTQQAILNIDYTPAGDTPTISSVDDTPDPTNPNRSVSFITNWADTDSTLVKAKVCKTNSLTSQICDGGYWATSTAFTTNNPLTLIYDVVTGDAGQTRDYTVFVCDDGGLCSTGYTGNTFSVNGQSSVPNVRFR